MKPDYIFETSWEVCNKVGGIHTVVSTKALSLLHEYKSNYMVIGPDVWRETDDNTEFVEDLHLLKAWREKAQSEGLRCRVGRWNIEGRPIAILVEYQSFAMQKDQIFAEFWESYKLDSISGQWDYVEPCLFGYAAGKVIESFLRFSVSGGEKVVAQFHEWMTGSGILYLKKHAPEVATVFSTHATVLGRAVAGNGQPLYGMLSSYEPNRKAEEFGVVAKQSMESISAAETDCFATVSEITGAECVQFLGKPADIVTPNGFEDSFVPKGEAFTEGVLSARKKLLQVSKALFGSVSDNPFFVGIGGRYEFKNKGIDLFIDAMKALSEGESPAREVIALLLIPANHYGARKDIQQILTDGGMPHVGNKYLTHNLHDADFDAILRRIGHDGLLNLPESKVKIMFVPCYLNGNDGIFNLTYYQLLMGLDMTVFPSYYEPWGYTPLESLAFHVPTITTTLAGFGLWVKKHLTGSEEGVKVIERNDTNDAFVVSAISRYIREATHWNEKEIEKARKAAFNASRIALWKNFVEFYYDAYRIALTNQAARLPITHVKRDLSEHLPPAESFSAELQPKWRRVLVEKNVPQNLFPLEELSKNLWWSWNPDAADLFASIDEQLWMCVEKNPVFFLERLPYTRLLDLSKDQAFMTRLLNVYKRYTEYMSQKELAKGPRIAYFSMEYGLHSSLKIYSGGLGILAGDYLKEASDRNIPLVAVGLLYRYGYFKQQISARGDQIHNFEPQNFAQRPVQPVRDEQGNWIRVVVALPGRNLYAKIWKAQVGRVDLYLLDTDFEDNLEADRSVTHQLYGGGEENRFKQELLLGIGGIRALRALRLKADLFHCNEGHAAFIGLERLSEFINQENLTFSEGLELVRSSTLFTTHTPVPAGHDAFPEGLIQSYISHYPARLKISWERFMGLGRIVASDPNERFSMSYLAASLSQEMNGVSKLHGKVSQDIFARMWPGYLPDELHVGYVTNGVHYPTWTAKEWRELYESRFGADFIDRQMDKECWNRIYEVSDKEVWSIRTALREKLIRYIDSRIDFAQNQSTEDPKYLVEVLESLSGKSLTIGFARRFATYKRAHLLFKDLNRLAEIVNNEERPVQFLFAGKAHPADKAGQDLIKMIVEISKRPEFVGKILFLENYDMELASHLVQGVDVWMNTPTRPLEASGTSGEKAVMNGGLHFSVLDGWWYEGYVPDAGWALSDKIVYSDDRLQDELDASIIYNLIENEIAPAYYERNAAGIPERWVGYVKNSIARVASNFTTTRMMHDYMQQYYIPQSARFKKLKSRDFELAKEISGWKKKLIRSWSSIELLEVKGPDIGKGVFVVGNPYEIEVVLDLKELLPEDVGVEVITVEPDPASPSPRLVQACELTHVTVEADRVRFQGTLTSDRAGTYDFGIRLFPKNSLMPHRQDLALVKWL